MTTAVLKIMLFFSFIRTDLETRRKLNIYWFNTERMKGISCTGLDFAILSSNRQKIVLVEWRHKKFQHCGLDRKKKSENLMFLICLNGQFGECDVELGSFQV